MSEKKKVFVERAYSAAPGEPSQATAGSEGGGSPTKKVIVAEAVTTVVKRAPAQSVLPDILGKQLRTAYSELLNDPVPDRFNELIKDLERREAEDAEPGTPQDEEASQ